MSEKNPNYSFVKKMDDVHNPWKGDYIDESAFMDWLKQYEGTDYYNQYLNAFNAYNGQHFSPNFFQSWGEQWFEDTSARSNFENQRLSTFFDSLARIQDAQHQESYNSEPSQVERQRQAGLNPDLTGGVSPGQAGNVDNPELATPALNEGSSVVPEVASSAMQVISMGMSMAQGFQQLSSGELSLFGQQLNLLNDSDKIISEQLGKVLTERQVRILLDRDAKDGDNNPKWTTKEIREADLGLNNAISILSNDPRISRSLRKKISKSWKLGAGSIGADTKLYQLLKDSYSNKRGAVEGAGHPFTNGGFENCLDIFGKHINDTIIKVQKLTAKFETDKLSVKDENGDSLGTAAGKSDLAAYNSEATAKEYQKLVDDMWKDIMRDLQGEDTWWSHLLMFLVPIARSWLSNMSLPSVSHSTSMDSKGNAKSGTSWSF